MLAPLIFGGQLTHAAPLLHAAAAFALFCLASGAVYLLNDLVDRNLDRIHPTKRHRPIASGALPVAAAKVLFGVLGVGVAAGALALSPHFALLTAGYALLNVAYSFVLKRVVFLDVACISAGFILRILAGGAAVGVPVSAWLVAVTFLLALFLALGKRKHELLVAGADAPAQRGVLRHYRLAHLNLALNVAAAAVTSTYLAYTLSERTIAVFGTHNLVFSLPFIVFGLVRYLQILETHREADSPTDTMIRDLPFLLNGVAWGITVTLIIYAR